MGRSIEAVLASKGVRVEGESLAHYGTKGMRWGKRKARKAERTQENQRRAEARAKTKSMSDDELKTAIARLKLEKEYKDLNAHQISEGQKLVNEILRDVGKQTAKGLITNTINSAVNAKADDKAAAKELLKKTLKKTVAPTPAPVGRVPMKLVGQT